MSQATVYLIRHGEKPPTGDDLSVQGVERSKALVEVFGSQSQYNIGYIMAQRPKEDGLVIPFTLSFPRSTSSICPIDAPGPFG